MNIFISQLWENPRFFLSWILFVVFSVCLHEFMHSFVALKEGDDTAARLGHLTLNPFRQMGFFSLIMLLLIGICWGRVPVDPRNFRRKYSHLIVSLAGPFTNFGLFIVFTLISGLALRLGYGSEDRERFSFFVTMFLNGAVMNMVLFIFNMLPVPGFDGYSLVENFVPPRFKNTEFFKGASIIVLMAAFFFSGHLFALSEIAVFGCIRFIMWL